MLHLPDVTTEIIIPVTKRMRMGGPSAVALMELTFLAESYVNGHTYIRQIGGGAARSPWQMEPATAKDIVGRYFEQKPAIRVRISEALYGLLPADVRWDELWTEDDDRALEFRLASDLGFACALARIRYWMDPQPLPSPNDVDGLAHYHKRVFNTAAGAADPVKTAALYRRYLSGQLA